MSDNQTSNSVERRFGWIAPSPKGNGTIDIGVHPRLLTNENWIEYEQIVGALTALRPFIIDYLIFERDYEEVASLKERLPAICEEHIEHSMNRAGVGVINAQVVAQRATSNFLSSASAFRDRARTLVKEQFGEPSSELQRFDLTVRNEYDSCFAYRLLYNLRNYSQHHTSPLDTIFAEARAIEMNQLKFEVEIDLIRDVLLTKGHKFQPKVLVELANMPEKFDLIPQAREYYACHSRILFEIIRTHYEQLDLYADYVKRLVEVLRIPTHATPVIFEGADRQARRSIRKFTPFLWTKWNSS